MGQIIALPAEIGRWLI